MSITEEPAYFNDLAEALEALEEVTLGPTDTRMLAVAARHYAAFLYANMPLPAS